MRKLKSETYEWKNTKMQNENKNKRINISDKYNTVIFLVRHGQSIGNAKREFLGHTNKDLSELGYLQARKTAEFLAEEKIDAIYSSDLLRAYNTAVPHAKMRKLKINTRESLRELYAGLWEGMMVEDIIKQYPHEFLEEWRGKNYGITTIPGGESVQAGAERFYAEVLKIAREHEGKSVLITAHAAVIRGFWGKLLRIAPEDLGLAFDYPTNASVSVLYYDGTDLVAGEYSHDEHLLNVESELPNEA